MKNIAGLRNRIACTTGRTYNTKTSSSSVSTAATVINPLASSPSSFLPSNNVRTISKRRRKHQEGCSTPDVIVTPPPTPTEVPILLLEGDQYHLSENGIARSVYQITSSSSSLSSPPSDNNPTSSMAVEELYDIENASKSYLFRNMIKEKNDNNNSSLLLGEALRAEPLMLQEINGSIHSTNN